jgi:hypothetical protein
MIGDLYEVLREWEVAEPGRGLPGDFALRERARQMRDKLLERMRK